MALGALGAPPVRAARAPRITYYFGLKRPEAAARSAFFAVGDPRSASYRRFATVRQVAKRYGASRATRRAFLYGVRRRGFTARVDRSGVFARVTGSVGRFERVFHVRVRRQFDNDVLADIYVPVGGRALREPRDLRPLVRDVVPAYSRSTPAPSPPMARAAADGPGNAGTWTGGCRAARATGAYSFAQVRRAYGLDRVGRGAGGSVAILNVGEGSPARDRDEAARCAGTRPPRARILRTDGQARPFGRGSFEPQEDFDLVSGMAPRLRSVTFSQVWLASQLWFLGAAQLFSAPRRPDSFSISYGLCERDVRGPGAPSSARAGANLLDALLVRLGLVGVSTFASAGDSGSTCNGQPVPGAAWPASSPFLTAVGGTRLVLDRANRRTDEVVWNDLRWLSAGAGGGAGGGGLSDVSARPPFQRGLSVAGTRRATPDVAAHASSYPGWPVVLAGNWVVDGGTSASAPLLAAAFADIDARERRAGRPRLGPVDGLLYAMRRRAPDTFFDVVRGANGYDARVPAHRARPGYDLASGLGVPRFDRLARALPPPAARSGSAG
jgi:Pro-kumamolisin, activation domain